MRPSIQQETVYAKAPFTYFLNSKGNQLVQHAGTEEELDQLREVTASDTAVSTRNLTRALKEKFPQTNWSETKVYGALSVEWERAKSHKEKRAWRRKTGWASYSCTIP